MHTANLVMTVEVRDVPPDILPFVQFKAEVEGRKLEPTEKVCVLVIGSTTCYIPVFLNEPMSMADLEIMLERQDAQLSAAARYVLSRHLKK
jgi:hypothetical protein